MKAEVLKKIFLFFIINVILILNIGLFYFLNSWGEIYIKPHINIVNIYLGIQTYFIVFLLTKQKKFSVFISCLYFGFLLFHLLSIEIFIYGLILVPLQFFSTIWLLYAWLKKINNKFGKILLYTLILIIGVLSVILYIDQKISHDKYLTKCMAATDSKEIWDCNHWGNHHGMLTRQEVYDMLYIKSSNYDDDSYYFDFEEATVLCERDTPYCKVRESKALESLRDRCFFKSKNSSDICVNRYLAVADISEKNISKFNELLADKDIIYGNSSCEQELVNFYKRIPRKYNHFLSEQAKVKCETNISNTLEDKKALPQHEPHEH